MQNEAKSRHVYMLTYVKKKSIESEVTNVADKTDNVQTNIEISGKVSEQMDKSTSMVDAVKNRERKKNSKYVEESEDDGSNSTEKDQTKQKYREGGGRRKRKKH